MRTECPEAVQELWTRQPRVWIERLTLDPRGIPLWHLTPVYSPAPHLVALLKPAVIQIRHLIRSTRLKCTSRSIVFHPVPKRRWHGIEVVIGIDRTRCAECIPLHFVG